MTLRALYNYVKSQLSPNSADPAAEALSILDSFCGVNRVSLAIHGGEEVDGLLVQKVKEMTELRRSGYPLQYLSGRSSFYGRDFSVGEGVLIPRFDTEILVDVAKELIKNTHRPVIADLCSGSGAIAVTLQKEIPLSEVYAVELYDAAFNWLLENIRDLDSEVIPLQCDVTREIPKSLNDTLFDMIVSNPPYINEKAMKKLPADVKKEPKTALSGGADGLYFYRAVTPVWSKCLKKGGRIVFEIGFDQKKSVFEILKENGFTDIACKKDFSGNDRVVFGTLK